MRVKQGIKFLWCNAALHLCSIKHYKTMQQEAIAMTPEATTTTQAVYSLEDVKAITAIGNATPAIKTFIFATIVLFINAVAYL